MFESLQDLQQQVPTVSDKLLVDLVNGIQVILRSRSVQNL